MAQNQPGAANPEHVILPVSKTFSVQNPNDDQKKKMVAAANDIGSSGFGTVVITGWEVRSDGQLYCDGAPIFTIINNLKSVIPIMKSAGSVKKVILRFGNLNATLNAIQSNYGAFTTMILTIREVCGLDGIDWADPRGWEHDTTDLGQYSFLLTTLTDWLNMNGMISTASPFATDPNLWISLLKQTKANGKDGFAWWNTQDTFYFQSWHPAEYDEWVPMLKGVVPEPEAFLIYGPMQIDPAVYKPGDIQGTLSGYVKNHFPMADGCNLMDYEFLIAIAPVKAYADAIYAGLKTATAPIPKPQLRQ